MSKLIRSSALASLLALAVPLFAQTEPPPAYLAVLDGDTSLFRDGDFVDAVVNMPIVNGDRLTTTGGRAEILYPDGAALDLDAGSIADFGRDGRIRLSSGRAILVVPNIANAGRYEIETPTGTIVTRGAGKYRADAAPSSAWALDPRANDVFDGWSDGLRAARAVPTTSASAQYLPDELHSYTSTLDQNGTWQYAPTYGYVWYPRVDSDWRPYYDGTWTTVPSYGWTWVGVQRWAYPTHHYGRWGYANNRWFWIPGRAYSPAWVAWGYSGDYVSWCPLGIDSRPAVAMTVGYGNPWTAWTVVPKAHFGGRGYVPRVAVPGHQVSSQTTPFVVQNTAPAIAVPRQSPVTGRQSPVNGVAVPRVAPTPSAPVPPPPQTILPAPTPPSVAPPPPQRAPDDRRPTAVPRGERRPSGAAPTNSGDNPAYAPRYAPTSTAPAQTPPTGPTTPPPAAPAAAPGSTPPQRTPPQTPPPKSAPSGGGSGLGTPRKEEPAPTKSGDGSPKAAEKTKPAEKAKPAESGKARGRGGL